MVWGGRSRKWRKIPNILKHDKYADNMIRKFSLEMVSKDEVDYSSYPWTHDVDDLEAYKRLLINSKIFEVTDDVTKLLERTKNKIRKTRLPFPIIFLDASPTFKMIWAQDHKKWIKRKELNYHGFLLAESGVHKDEHSIIPSTITVPPGHKHPENIYIYGVFSLPDSNRVGNLKITLYEDYDYLEGQYVDGSSKRWNRERQLVREFVMNCLDFINEPDVKYVERIRAYSPSKKRMRAGKGLRMPTMIVKITGELKRCLDNISMGGHFSYSYRFWVRGHWRRFTSELYTRSGLKGKRKWIMPFIKGEGILIDRRYQLVKE